MKMEREPLCIMMVGLPGSGKSVSASCMKQTWDYGNGPHVNIHSSDDIRQELYGDANNQEHNDKVFRCLHARIKADLEQGVDVIFDATNINKKQRIHFLNMVGGICVPVCHVMATPIDHCLWRNQKRGRQIPPNAIRGMLNKFQPPAYSEGFSSIHYETASCDAFSVEAFAKISDTFDQRNRHHALTLGQHSQRVVEYLYQHGITDKRLLFAGYLHDNGKLLTATPTNQRGESDGDYHYYNHENVGAYNSIFYAFNAGFNPNDVTYISNLIYYHMRPYIAWKQSVKAYQRDLKLCGADFIRDVELLHEADLASH